MEVLPAMRLLTARRSRSLRLPGVTGTVRLDRRTKNLTKRLRPGDIAVIEHVDLDRATAEELVACRVAAVVNAATSISGRYPNLGPEILARAGIALVDDVGPDVFRQLREGDWVRLHDGVAYRGDVAVVEGQVLDGESVATAMEQAKSGMSAQLEAFAANTAEFLRREHQLLLEGAGAPPIDTPLSGRHVLVAVPGSRLRADLGALRSYIRECRPVLVGVDGGADALLAAGYRPDLIVGDTETVSDKALRSGAEVLVHAARNPQAPERDRLERLGVRAVVFSATGSSADLAMLLADVKGASLLVAVGHSATLVELLDRGRAEMASSFLIRLRVGHKLVDAKAVSQLYRGRVATGQLLMLVLAGLVAVSVAIAATPVGGRWLDALGGWWGTLTDTVLRLVQ